MEQLSFREMFVRYQEALRDADKVMCTLERLVATNWECDCEKLKMRQNLLTCTPLSLISRLDLVCWIVLKT